MNFADWYTDTVDIYRVEAAKTGSLTRQTRKQVAAAIPCRIYESRDKAIRMTGQAADIQQECKLACANEVDIRTGDELIIHRGGGLGKVSGQATRAFAGEPYYYLEPFGGVDLGLAHQEVLLLQQERVD